MYQKIKQRVLTLPKDRFNTQLHILSISECDRIFFKKAFLPQRVIELKGGFSLFGSDKLTKMSIFNLTLTVREKENNALRVKIQRKMEIRHSFRKNSVNSGNAISH